MGKILVAVVTLLLSHLSLGATAFADPVSTNLSITVQPAPPPPTQTCDYGSPMAAPAPAAAAGFNRCALNADFTVAGGFFSNPANFLDCAGGPGPYHFTLEWYGTAQCNQFSVDNSDAAGGAPQVGHLKYTKENLNSGGSQIALAWPGGACCSGPSDSGGPNGKGLPFEGYFEITLRMPVESLNGNDPNNWWLPLAVWLQKNDTYRAAYWDETDFFELTQVGHRDPATGWNWHLTAFHDWSCAPDCSGWGGIVDLGGDVKPPPLPASQCPGGGADCGDAYWDGAPQDFSTYHKYGFLVTSDEQSHVSMCLYLDDVLQRCQRGYAGTRPSLQYHQMYNDYVIWLGSFGMVADHIDLYIKTMRVFECQNYNSDTCPGPVICPTGKCFDGPS